MQQDYEGKGGQWQQNLAHREVHRSGLFGISQTEF